MKLLRKRGIVPFAVFITCFVTSALAASAEAPSLSTALLPPVLIVALGAATAVASRRRGQSAADAILQGSLAAAGEDAIAAFKAGCERSLALAFFVAGSPLMLAGMALVRLTSPGKAIYSQERVGLNGKPFTIYKIRTMVADCERDTGPRWSTPGDPRVTPVGRVLRKLHVDELPQLWNAVRGELSLVGPRPERPAIVERLEASLTGYGERPSVRPGVTGLAQVQQEPDVDVESVRRKLFQDLHYVRHASVALDLRILAATALHCLAVPGPVIARLFGFPSLQQVAGEAVARGQGLDCESRQEAV